RSAMGPWKREAPEGVEPSRPCGHPVTNRTVCTLLPLGTVARAPSGTRTRTSAVGRRHAAAYVTDASVLAELSRSVAIERSWKLAASGVPSRRRLKDCFPGREVRGPRRHFPARLGPRRRQVFSL